MPSMKEHWGAIFDDMAAAAGREDLISSLKTADLPAGVKERQLDKLKSLTVFLDDLVEMPRAGFVSRFKDGSDVCICVQTNDFSEHEHQELSDCLEFYNTYPDDMDESTFMLLSLRLKGWYRKKTEYLEKDSAFNQISIAGETGYSGHEISDIIKLYEEVSLFRVDGDSFLATCNKWYLAAHVASSCSAFRTKSFPLETSLKLNKLLLLKNTNPELIFYAVTSIHLRQCFLEVYRGLEALFYLPWMKNLKADFKLAESGRLLASKLRKSIGWRQKEVDSICELFAIADKAKVVCSRIEPLPAFSGINFDEATNQVMARRIYKVRNILVHQEDYEDPDLLKMTQECWPILVDYLLDVCLDLYVTNGSDADFDFNSS